MLSAACLEAPERGMPGDDVAPPPDQPGGADGADGADDGDGAAVAGAPDGGAPGPIVCGDGSGAAVVYASLVQAPLGQANIDFAGIALLVNTGRVAIDTTQFVAIADDVPGYNVTPVITVGQLGDIAPVGQAVGQWVFDPDLLEPNLPEPWTDTAQPRVDLSVSYDVPSTAEFDIMMMVDQEGLGAVVPIHVQVAGNGAPTVGATARLPLHCDPQ